MPESTPIDPIVSTSSSTSSVSSSAVDLPPISSAEVARDLASALDTIAPLLAESLLGANPLIAFAFKLVWPLIRLEISRLGAQEIVKTVGGFEGHSTKGATQ